MSVYGIHHLKPGAPPPPTEPRWVGILMIATAICGGLGVGFILLAIILIQRA